MNRNITIVSMGHVSSELLSWLANRLEEVFDQTVIIGEEITLPVSGYNSRRSQYQGDALLASLQDLHCSEVEQLVGVLEADCYSPGLNFIFGQAVSGGRVAFVALPRLRQSFYGLPEDPELFRERVLKEVVHELGHTWGLSHCPSTKCVMHFSNSLHDTDVKGDGFCSRCKNRLSFE